MQGCSPQERFCELMDKDPRFHAEAYGFVFEALDYTVREVHGTDPGPEPPSSHHVTGRDLLEGIRRYALERFGCLAALVFHFWGIHRTDHFGEMVFNLVDHGLMGKQDSDRKEDFADGFGGRPFEEIFHVDPVLEYYPEKDEWKASYENVVYG
ncbi:MAG: Minf_1886 family protein [Planctomycetota bacterium]